jgi:hypothetical protein
VSTPSERIFAHLEDDDGVELRHFLPAQARNPMTLARTADRIAAGTARREAVADFVNDLRWVRDEEDIARRITERPHNLDPRTDAYLAAHFAAAHEAPAPLWASEPGRFLSRIWWPRYPGLWARAIVESPAAFRRRGILLGAGMLSRV